MNCWEEIGLHRRTVNDGRGHSLRCVVHGIVKMTSLARPVRPVCRAQLIPDTKGNKMSPLLGRMAITAILACATLIGTGLGSAIAQDTDHAVAIVNGEKIFLSDVQEARKSLPAQAQDYPFEILFEHLVGNLVDTKLLALEARRIGIDKEESIKARLANIEEQVLRQALLKKEVEAELSEEKLRNRYETFVKDNKSSEEIHARHILLETEEKALDVIAKLVKGADFPELAKAVSNGPSGKKGGNLGFFNRERMVPAFSAAAFELKPGEITRQPVKTQFGWHVIKVEARRKSLVPSFAKMRGQLKETLRNNLSQAYLEKLAAKAKIERFGPDGQPRQK